MAKVQTSVEVPCCHFTIEDSGTVRDVLVVNGPSGDAWTLVCADDGTFRAAWRLELEPGEELGVEELALAAVARLQPRNARRGRRPKGGRSAESARPCSDPSAPLEAEVGPEAMPAIADAAADAARQRVVLEPPGE
jgi:hypothetical protein